MSNGPGYSRQSEKNEPARQESKRDSAKPVIKSIQPLTALQFIKSGGKVRDLSPEQLRELETAAGNQTVLALFQSAGGTLPLTCLPLEKAGKAPEELPENPVGIRWPALFPYSERTMGTAPKEYTWSIKELRAMGQYEGGFEPV